MVHEEDALGNMDKFIDVWGLETKRGRMKPVVFRFMWQAILAKGRGDKVVKGKLRKA